MNFDKTEKIREELFKNCKDLKKIKTKTKQAYFSELSKNIENNIEELCKEIVILKDEFRIFKLNTLSTIENKEINNNESKCVTSPFSIYISQK